MTYWAARRTGIAEASCIEKDLPISKLISEPIVALGYWPRYESMTPGQLGNYLHWLSMAKQGQLEDIGYAFVYFLWAREAGFDRGQRYRSDYSRNHSPSTLLS